MDLQPFQEWCGRYPWLERVLKALPDPKLKITSTALAGSFHRCVPERRQDPQPTPLREDASGWYYRSLGDVSYSLNVGVFRSEGGRILMHVFGCYIRRRMKDHGLRGSDHSDGTIGRELGIIGAPPLLYLVRVERDDETPPLTVKIWDMSGANFGQFFVRQRRELQAETLRLLKEAAR